MSLGFAQNSQFCTYRKKVASWKRKANYQTKLIPAVVGYMGVGISGLMEQVARISGRCLEEILNNKKMYLGEIENIGQCCCVLSQLARKKVFVNKFWGKTFIFYLVNSHNIRKLAKICYYN